MVINDVAIQIQEINTKSNKQLFEVIGLVTSCRYVQNVLLVEYRDTWCNKMFKLIKLQILILLKL